MKKLFIIIPIIMLAVLGYSQTSCSDALRIQTHIDSLLTNYNIHQVDIHSPHLTNVKSTVNFHLENGFLVVNKMEYFNLEKLLSFEIFMNFITKKYTLVIYFD